MAGPPRSSFPSAPSEPNLRRLGLGGNGGGERPLRAQLVVALVVGLILIAVPLYLWRRPTGKDGASADAGAAASAGAVIEAGSIAVSPVDAGKFEERVKLGAPQKVRCSAGPGAQGQEGNLCDTLHPLEEALAKAISENADCAPRGPKEGTINFVLTVDFAQRKLHIFPGASGNWKGPQARRATQCVKRALSAPSWEALKHQYRYYQIAILATFLPAGSAGPATGPTFDEPPR
jgi:hypothetical protein